MPNVVQMCIEVTDDHCNQPKAPQALNGDEEKSSCYWRRDEMTCRGLQRADRKKPLLKIEAPEEFKESSFARGPALWQSR